MSTLEQCTYSKFRLCGSYIELKEYTRSFNCSKREKVKKKYLKPDFRIIDSLDDLPEYVRRSDSISRARNKCYDIIACNIGKYPKFLTLTCRQSVLDYDEFLYLMKQFFKNMKRKGYDLQYFWIPEHQLLRGLKEGNEGSYHAHIIIFNDEKIPFKVINSCWDGNTDIHIFKGYRYKDGVQTDEKIRDIASYVVKYITKETITEFGRNSYHCSRGLFRPVEISEKYTVYRDKKNQKAHLQKDKNDISNISFDYIKEKFQPLKLKSYMYLNGDNSFGCQVTIGKLKEGVLNE